MTDKIEEFLTELVNTNIDLTKLKESFGNTCLPHFFEIIFFKCCIVVHYKIILIFINFIYNESKTIKKIKICKIKLKNE